MENWLPRLELLEDHAGDWSAYLEHLYELFRHDFMGVLPRFRGRPMGLKYLPERAGKCGTFWHFISEGPCEIDRTPDLRRCETIRWPRRVLEEANAGSSRVCVWSNHRKNGAGWVISTPDFSYKFVLVERGEKVLPWTQYQVLESHQRRALEREYVRWLGSQKS